MIVADQVLEALRELHPGVRKDVRRALADLDKGERRDTKALEGKLGDFYRLRVGKYRVIYRFDLLSGEIVAEFLSTRDVVYEAFRPPE
ncbi:MAG: type II toxin-antitoxin system RelE/ParE family toxin [Opitutaceae bacterium]|jgi:mRNA interferase RelE/StbE|nr:type II toxin-antitoxin system RelE/ParE family toxin [Opitutaceae bacterium]